LTALDAKDTREPVVKKFLGAKDTSEPLAPKSLACSTKLIKGGIVSRDDTNMDGYRLFFGGYRTLTDTGGFFTFPLDFSPTKPLYILISKGAIWEYDKKNTLKALKQDRSKSYLFYVAKCHSNDDGQYTLSVTPEYLEGWNFQIPPERCLVVPMNPIYVKSVETWKSPFGKSIIRFPKIVLKDEIELQKGKAEYLASIGKRDENIRNEKKLRRIAQKSVLRSIEENPFHESAIQTTKEVKNKKNRSVRISMSH